MQNKPKKSIKILLKSQKRNLEKLEKISQNIKKLISHKKLFS